MNEKRKIGNLYLIPTTIAPDTYDQALPLSVKDAVNKIRYFLVENVRTARRFLSGWGVEQAIQDLQFEVLNKKTTQNELSSLFAPLYSGEDIGIMSEAGCPGVADPGALAVAYAHTQGVNVLPLVGPSSFLLALMGSGFSGQSFVFHGYLPIDKQQRVKAIKRIEKQAKEQQQTQIFMETPYRNNVLLEALLKTCHNNTQLCIAKGISAPHQFIRTLPIRYWKTKEVNLHKVPTVFLLSS